MMVNLSGWPRVHGRPCLGMMMMARRTREKGAASWTGSEAEHGHEDILPTPYIHTKTVHCTESRSGREEGRKGEKRRVRGTVERYTAQRHSSVLACVCLSIRVLKVDPPYEYSMASPSLTNSALSERQKDELWVDIDMACCPVAFV